MHLWSRVRQAVGLLLGFVDEDGAPTFDPQALLYILLGIAVSMCLHPLHP